MKLTPCFDPLGTVKMRDTQNIGPDSWYAIFPITLHQVTRIFKIRKIRKIQGRAIFVIRPRKHVLLV